MRFKGPLTPRQDDETGHEVFTPQFCRKVRTDRGLTPKSDRTHDGARGDMGGSL